MQGEWIENKGVQPVADDVLVDVRFFGEVKPYVNNKASEWEWTMPDKSSSIIEFWRLAHAGE